MTWFIVGAAYILGAVIMFAVIYLIHKVLVERNEAVDNSIMMVTLVILLWPITLPITLGVIIAAVLKAYIDYAKEKREEEKRTKGGLKK